MPSNTGYQTVFAQALVQQLPFSIRGIAICVGTTDIQGLIYHCIALCQFGK